MLKRYSEYKDSGIEWAGQVPEPWVSKRLKHLVRLVNEKGVSEEDSLPINLENIESWTGRFISGEAVDQEPSEEEMKRFKSGDVLFNKLRPYLAKVYRADSDGACGGELLVLRPQKENMRSGFLFYRLLSKGFISVVDGSTYGTKMPRASWDFIGNLMIASPNIQEQEIISDFLDNKTMQIDDLIAKKEQMIDFLREERASVINQAVTKGLNKNCELKDSGVEWIGEVPKHWSMSPVKYHYDVQLGKMLQNASLKSSDQLVPYLKALHVHWDKIIVDDLPEMWADKSELSQYGVDDGDLLVCEGGEVGRAGIVHNPPKNCIIQNALHRVRVKNKEALIGYLLYVMYVANAVEWLSILCNKATIAHFTREKFIDLQMPIPPIHEQQDIIDFLDHKTAQIDMQVARLLKSIEILKEFRASLISEVVTGKIDVRGYAA